MLSKNLKYFYCLFITYFINYCNILFQVCIIVNLNWCSTGKSTVFDHEIMTDDLFPYHNILLSILFYNSSIIYFINFYNVI